MSKQLCNLCSNLGIQRTSITPCYKQRKAKTERPNWKTKESLSEYIGQNRHVLPNSSPLAMMAERSLIHSITKYRLAYMTLGCALSLHIDCICSKQQTAKYAALSVYIFLMKQCSRPEDKMTKEVKRSHYDQLQKIKRRE